jgi:hypothetical protein
MSFLHRIADDLAGGDGFLYLTESARQCHETMRKQDLFLSQLLLPGSFSRRLLVVATFLAAVVFPEGDGLRSWTESAGQCHETLGDKMICSFRDSSSTEEFFGFVLSPHFWQQSISLKEMDCVIGQNQQVSVVRR